MMAARNRKAYINAHVLSPAQGLDGKGGILIEDGWILGVGSDVTRESSGSQAQIIDCKGRIIAPGLIDMRVFTGEPGSEYRETQIGRAHV